MCIGRGPKLPDRPPLAQGPREGAKQHGGELPERVPAESPLRERRADRPERPEREASPPPAECPLDPMARALAQPACLSAPPVAATAAETPAGQNVTIEVLIQRLVRKVAWGGDGKRGAARIELGAGALSGATVTLLSEGDGLVVEVDLPRGQSADEWRDKIERGFAARGLAVREITVR